MPLKPMNNLDIIFEDSAILVVNKPAGLIVNTSQTSGDVTLQNLVAATIVEDPKDVTDEETDFRLRKGIVHRLDKDTSGVLLIAKTEDAFTKIQEQFKAREVEKEYLALAIGPIADDVFEINAPLKRNPRLRFKYAVVADGKDAMTRFEKIKELEIDSDKLTLLKVSPKTGRTHQIRVHLAAFGHPIVGDVIYSSKKQLERWSPFFVRMMLHAHKITFTHPVSGERVTLEAPLPKEFVI